MFKMTIEVLISQSFKNQQIIIENKFYLFGYKRCKRQLRNSKCCYTTNFCPILIKFIDFVPLSIFFIVLKF